MGIVDWAAPAGSRDGPALARNRAPVYPANLVGAIETPLLMHPA